MLLLLSLVIHFASKQTNPKEHCNCATMASTAGLTLREPPIKLINAIKEEDLVCVLVTDNIPVQGAPTGVAEKRKVSLLKLVESATDFVELLCHVATELLDAARSERLRLATGHLLHSKF